MADAPDGELVSLYRGTELVQCGERGCWRAVIAQGPLDIELTLELVDEEGWSYQRPRHYCPDHSPQ